jgi:hypothetical protein
MSEFIYAGLTSQSIDVMIYDSSSTTGAGLSGLVYNSSGLKAYYRIGATGASTAITLATQTATGAWSSGGFVEIDATNMKGVYRLDIPNAVAATAAMVSIYLYGATNMMGVAQRVDCRAVPVDMKLIAGQTANAAAAVTFPATIASTTNITSASGIVPATGAITNAQAATIPTSGTITTGTNQTGDGYSYLTTNLGLLGANLSAVPKTGFKLASDGLASVTAWTVGITGNITGNLSGSVGSVTSAIVLPTAPTDWITSASVSAAAVTKIQSGLSTYAGGDTSGTTTLLTRVTATAAFPTATQVATIPTSGTINTTTPPTVVQIRTEMDANSTKLDATVSSRMATFTYTSPVGAAVNASQIGGVSAIGVLVSPGVGSSAFLANAPTGSGGGGTGANPVTITIQTTLSVAIQGATVTAWKNGSISGTLATNVSGVAVLALDAGTYSIVVTANGYQGNTGSLVVSGTTSQTYQLTAITITPSPSGGVTGYLYTTDTTGTVIQTGVVVEIQMTRTASGQTGEAISPVIKTVTSDSSGLAQFVGLTPGATYRFSTTRGTSWATFVAGSVAFEITSAVV